MNENNREVGNRGKVEHSRNYKTWRAFDSGLSLMHVFARAKRIKFIRINYSHNYTDDFNIYGYEYTRNRKLRINSGRHITHHHQSPTERGRGGK